MKSAAAYAAETGRKFADFGCDVVQFKSDLTSAAKEARRAARKGWHAAEDYVDQFSIAVRKNPIKSMGMGFGMALGIGALVGWLAGRNRY